MHKRTIFIILLLTLCSISATACSILYYIHPETGHIYVINNEDYWYDTDAYIQINPASDDEYARLWYGWDDFAQGGVDEQGLFFDSANVPKQKKVKGGKKPKGNLGDRLLAQCKNVVEALAFIEKGNLALTDSNLFLGDSSGNAVIVEWVEGKKQVIHIAGNQLVSTNYLHSDPAAGNYPCPKYQSIENRIHELESSTNEYGFLEVANCIGGAVQVPQTNDAGRTGGTLYSSFIDLTDQKLVLSYKISNQNMLKLDLKEEFSSTKSRKIMLENI